MKFIIVKKFRRFNEVLVVLVQFLLRMWKGNLFSDNAVGFSEHDYLSARRSPKATYRTRQFFNNVSL